MRLSHLQTLPQHRQHHPHASSPAPQHQHHLTSSSTPLQQPSVILLGVALLSIIAVCCTFSTLIALHNNHDSQSCFQQLAQLQQSLIDQAGGARGGGVAAVPTSRRHRQSTTFMEGGSESLMMMHRQMSTRQPPSTPLAHENHDQETPSSNREEETTTITESNPMNEGETSSNQNQEQEQEQSTHIVQDHKEGKIPAASTSSSSLSASSSFSSSSALSYSAAIMVLRCFTTPGCFRSIKCGVNPQTQFPLRIPRRKKWEEQAFCVDDLKRRAKELRQQAKEKQQEELRPYDFKSNNKENNNNDNDDSSKCLVYSFGIHTSWEWEQKVANLFGCHVFAFDPTMKYPTKLAHGVTFYPWGLQGAGTDMSVTHASQYDKIHPSSLLTLDEIAHRLGHDGRTIDLLMLDCEGCEWGVLRQLYCSANNNHNNPSTTTTSTTKVQVSQLVVELHFQKNLGLLNEQDVLHAAQTVLCLEEARWGIVSHESSGVDRADAEYTTDVIKVLHGVSGGFLLNLALRRIPEDDEPLPHQVLEKNTALGKKWDRARTACMKMYQKQIKDIHTAEACPEFAQLNAEFNKGIATYNAMVRKRATFDTPDRLDENKWVYPSDE